MSIVPMKLDTVPDGPDRPSVYASDKWPPASVSSWQRQSATSAKIEYFLLQWRPPSSSVRFGALRFEQIPVMLDELLGRLSAIGHNAEALGRRPLPSQRTPNDESMKGF